MKELVLPVPGTVSATYIVPVPVPMSTVEARRQAGKAVEARLTGPLRTLTAEWLAKGAVKVKVEPAGTPPPDRKSTRLNSSHPSISYAVFCLKKKINRLTDEPAALIEVRPDLHFPPWLQHTLDTALARIPVNRYQSASKFFF